MSETVWIALINAMVTLIAAIVGVSSAYIALQVKVLDLKTKMSEFNDSQTAKTDNINYNMHKIEAQTNSMKDQLVLATKQAALLTGEQVGKDKEILRQQSELADLNSINIENVEQINVAKKAPIKEEKKP